MRAWWHKTSFSFSVSARKILTGKFLEVSCGDLYNTVMCPSAQMESGILFLSPENTARHCIPSSLTLKKEVALKECSHSAVSVPVQAVLSLQNVPIEVVALAVYNLWPKHSLSISNLLTPEQNTLRSRRGGECENGSERKKSKTHSGSPVKAAKLIGF